MMGAFQQAVDEFGGRGVPVIPTRRDRPSKPLVNKPEAFGVRAARSLAAKSRYENANAAVWCGPNSKLTIVDVDDNSTTALDAALERFGESPLIAQTPSGGWHLYFRHNGERRIIRPFGEECRLDILGDGLAVVPPSTRARTSDKAGGNYRIVQGDFSALERLRPIRAVDLPKSIAEGPQVAIAGQRNNVLFQSMLGLASMGYDFDTLCKMARDSNADLADPLPLAEVEKTVRSAVAYREQGRLFVPGGGASTTIAASELDTLDGDGDAVLLLVKLRVTHGVHGQPFTLAKATKDIFGWTAYRYLRARKTLTNLGFIECLNPGGTRPGDVPVYRLSMGCEIVPQNNKHPLPLRPGT